MGDPNARVSGILGQVDADATAEAQQFSERAPLAYCQQTRRWQCLGAECEEVRGVLRAYMPGFDINAYAMDRLRRRSLQAHFPGG